MVELFAKSGDNDRMLQNAVSDLVWLFTKYPFRGLQITMG